MKTTLTSFGERASKRAERLLCGAITNPVTATVVTVGGVLSNPFREERKSARRYYNKQRRYSNFVEDIDREVRDCPECDAHTHGVETRWHRAGERPWSSFSDAAAKPYERNTFCDNHLKKAFHAQEIIVASKPVYKGE